MTAADRSALRATLPDDLTRRALAAGLVEDAAPGLDVELAALVAVGYTLDELRNEITGGVTPASFEPTIDYVVTKVPRFTFEKFPDTDPEYKNIRSTELLSRIWEPAAGRGVRIINADGTVDETINLYRDEEGSSPMIRNGVLYTATTSILAYRIPSENLADSPWPVFRHDLKHTGRGNCDDF